MKVNFFFVVKILIFSRFLSKFLQNMKGETKGKIFNLILSTYFEDWIYIYMYVCMYVCMYVYIYIYIHIFLEKYIIMSKIIKATSLKKFTEISRRKLQQKNILTLVPPLRLFFRGGPPLAEPLLYE